VGLAKAFTHQGLTASLDEDGLGTFGEDDFGVFVLTGAVVDGFSGATKQTGMGVTRVLHHCAEVGTFGVSPPVWCSPAPSSTGLAGRWRCLELPSHWSCDLQVAFLPIILPIIGSELRRV
jgi:hypothetical protein